MEKTSLSPAATCGFAASECSFAMASMKELVGLKVDPKMVERAAETLGAEIAEGQKVEVEPPSGPYVGMDGTGVRLALRNEKADR